MINMMTAAVDNSWRLQSDSVPCVQCNNVAPAIVVEKGGGEEEGAPEVDRGGEEAGAPEEEGLPPEVLFLQFLNRGYKYDDGSRFVQLNGCQKHCDRRQVRVPHLGEWGRRHLIGKHLTRRFGAKRWRSIRSSWRSPTIFFKDGDGRGAGGEVDEEQQDGVDGNVVAFEKEQKINRQEGKKRTKDHHEEKRHPKTEHVDDSDLSRWRSLALVNDQGNKNNYPFNSTSRVILHPPGGSTLIMNTKRKIGYNKNGSFSTMTPASSREHSSRESICSTSETTPVKVKSRHPSADKHAEDAQSSLLAEKFYGLYAKYWYARNGELHSREDFVQKFCENGILGTLSAPDTNMMNKKNYSQQARDGCGSKVDGEQGSFCSFVGRVFLEIRQDADVALEEGRGHQGGSVDEERKHHSHQSGHQQGGDDSNQRDLPHDHRQEQSGGQLLSVVVCDFLGARDVHVAYFWYDPALFAPSGKYKTGGALDTTMSSQKKIGVEANTNFPIPIVAESLGSGVNGMGMPSFPRQISSASSCEDRGPPDVEDPAAAPEGQDATTERTSPTSRSRVQDKIGVSASAGGTDGIAAHSEISAAPSSTSTNSATTSINSSSLDVRSITDIVYYKTFEACLGLGIDTVYMGPVDTMNARFSHSYKFTRLQHTGEILCPIKGSTGGDASTPGDVSASQPRKSPEYIDTKQSNDIADTKDVEGRGLHSKKGGSTTTAASSRNEPISFLEHAQQKWKWLPITTCTEKDPETGRVIWKC
ncbi:unnamed protein product [Amoebophrya sp. A25]|nr:unnamed protein product [Amoebophrya sp. A25]|eukprot:GSA25T00012670001.1